MRKHIEKHDPEMAYTLRKNFFSPEGLGSKFKVIVFLFLDKL